MPKLSPDTQRARREHILDAAERCFVRSGFHRCTMQEICKEAEISPGALYLYFASKEDLIAGIAERERAEFQDRFSNVEAAPDFLTALNTVAEQYFVDEPIDHRRMCVEIGIEATRNETVGKIFRDVDQHILQSFEKLFCGMKGEGRIGANIDAATLARVFAVIGDGLVWRRATDPNFDAEAVLPVITEMVRNILQLEEGEFGSHQQTPKTKVVA